MQIEADRAECPACGAEGLQIFPVLHHLICAYVGPEYDFPPAEAGYTCPKCRRGIVPGDPACEIVGTSARCLQCRKEMVVSPLAAPSGIATAQESNAVRELIPTGKLRVGVVVAPAASAFFIVKDANGEPRGVTADLGRELGRKLGVPVEFMVAANSGLITDATETGAIDVSFMPVDEERKKRVDFGPAYFLIESTYVATAASGFKTVADVDRPNARVIGIANTTTIRAAARSLKNTTIAPVASVDEALGLLRAGKAEAFALSRDSLTPLVTQLPGSLIVDGGFQHTAIAIAVPKNRPNALAYVTAFLNGAKASGSVRRALDQAGFPNEPVAP